MSTQRVAVVDYGMGNLRSVAKARQHVAPHASVLVTRDATPLCRRTANSSQDVSRHEPLRLVSVSSQVCTPGSMRIK